MAQTCEDILRLLSDIQIATITQDTMGSIADMEKVTIPSYQNITNTTKNALRELSNDIQKKKKLHSTCGKARPSTLLEDKNSHKP